MLATGAPDPRPRTVRTGGPFLPGLDPALVVQTSARTVPRMMPIRATASPTTMARDRDTRGALGRRRVQRVGGGPALSYRRSSGTLLTAHCTLHTAHCTSACLGQILRQRLHTWARTAPGLTFLASPAVPQWASAPALQPRRRAEGITNRPDASTGGNQPTDRRQGRSPRLLVLGSAAVVIGSRGG